MMKPALHADLITVDDLPLMLRQIVAIIGLQATLLLVGQYGGVRLYVPVKMTPEHVLANLIGFDLAAKLSAAFGGMDHFDIPQGMNAVRLVRNRQIAQKFIAGESLRMLAREYRLSERQIQNIVADMGVSQESRQHALF